MRKILFWMIENVPLGRLAPFILGIAMGKMPIKKETNKWNG